MKITRDDQDDGHAEDTLNTLLVVLWYNRLARTVE